MSAADTSTHTLTHTARISCLPRWGRMLGTWGVVVPQSLGGNVLGPGSKSQGPWISLRPYKEILVLKLTHTLAHRPWALAPILHPAVLN